MAEYQTLTREHLKDPSAVLYALSECREPFLKALEKYRQKNNQPSLLQTAGLLSDLVFNQEEFLSLLPDQYKDKARTLLSKRLYETVDFFAQLVKMSFEDKPNWEILAYALGNAVKSKVTSAIRR